MLLRSSCPPEESRRRYQTPKMNTAPRYVHIASRTAPSAKRGPFRAEERPRAVPRVLSMNVSLPGLTLEGGLTQLPAYSPEEPFAVLAPYHALHPTSAVSAGGGKYFACCFPTTGDTLDRPSTLSRRNRQCMSRCGWVGLEGGEVRFEWDRQAGGVHHNGNDDAEDDLQVAEFLEATEALAVGNKIRVGDVWTPVSDNVDAPEVRIHSLPSPPPSWNVLGPDLVIEENRAEGIFL